MSSPKENPFDEPGAFHLVPLGDGSWSASIQGDDGPFPAELLQKWPRRRHLNVALLPCDLVWQAERLIRGHCRGQGEILLVPWKDCLRTLSENGGFVTDEPPSNEDLLPWGPDSDRPGAETPKRALRRLSELASARMEQIRILRAAESDAKPGRPRGP